VLIVPVVAFAVTVGISLGTNSSDEEPAPAVNVNVASRAPLSTAVPAAPPAQQVAPTATVLADRSDCATVRGTDYRSTTERDWFQKNCVDVARAAPSSGATSSGGTTASAASSGTTNLTTSSASTTARPATTTGTTSTTTGTTGTTPSSSGTTAAATTGSMPPNPRAIAGTESASGQRLVIPKASINADINVIKMTGYDMPDPKGYFNLLTYDMSGLGGSLGSNGIAGTGNLVLSGHVDCGKCNNGGPGIAVLWHVRDLGVGDTAQVYTADGKVVNYVVSSSRVLSGERSADWNNLLSAGSADMTIITCTGTFAGGEYDKRHVVQFKRA
jgi:hypothetical protein